jgi:hypothetical protein
MTFRGRLWFPIPMLMLFPLVSPGAGCTPACPACKARMAPTAARTIIGF